MEIRKTLVCSTAHVSRNVMMILDDDYNPHPIESCIYERLQHGWIIRYWRPSRDEERAGHWRIMPRCMKDVIERAESLGCNMIVFDSDADTIDGIRTYDW